MHLRRPLLFSLVVLGSSVAFPGIAAAKWVTQEELEANEKRIRAWNYYKQASTPDRAPGAALNFYLAARREWKSEDKILLYTLKKEYSGMEVRYRIVREKRHYYSPSSRIFDCLGAIINAEDKAAQKLPKTENRKVVEGAFKGSKKLIANLSREGLNPARIRVLDGERERRIKTLLASAKKAVKKPDPPKEPVKPKLPPKPKGPSKAELANRKNAFKIKMFELQESTNMLRQALRRGDFGKARYHAKEGAPSLAAAKTPLILPSWGEEYRELFAEYQDGCAGLKAMSVMSQALARPSSDPASLAAYARGLDAAELFKASAWSRAQQQQMAVALISEAHKDQSKASETIRPWLKVLEEPLARAILKVDLGDLAAQSLEEVKSRPKLEGLDPVRARRLATALAVRGFAIVEEAWELRKRTAFAAQRHELYREVLDVFLALKSAERHVPKGPAKTWLIQARNAVKQELTKAPYGLIHDRNDTIDGPVKRVAGYFDLLPRVEESLEKADLAKAYLAIGIGAWLILEDPTCEWIIERAYALDPKCFESIPKTVSGPTVDSIRERFGAKKKAG